MAYLCSLILRIHDFQKENAENLIFFQGSKSKHIPDSFQLERVIAFNIETNLISLAICQLNEVGSILFQDAKWEASQVRDP